MNIFFQFSEDAIQGYRKRADKMKQDFIDDLSKARELRVQNLTKREEENYFSEQLNSESNLSKELSQRYLNGFRMFFERYFEKNIYKFSEILEDMINRGEKRPKKIFEDLKTFYRQMRNSKYKISYKMENDETLADIDFDVFFGLYDSFRETSINYIEKILFEKLVLYLKAINSFISNDNVFEDVIEQFGWCSRFSICPEIYEEIIEKYFWQEYQELQEQEKKSLREYYTNRDFYFNFDEFIQDEESYLTRYLLSSFLSWINNTFDVDEYIYGFGESDEDDEYEYYDNFEEFNSNEEYLKIKTKTLLTKYGNTIKEIEEEIYEVKFVLSVLH